MNIYLFSIKRATIALARLWLDMIIAQSDACAQFRRRSLHVELFNADTETATQLTTPDA